MMNARECYFMQIANAAIRHYYVQISPNNRSFVGKLQLPFPECISQGATLLHKTPSHILDL